LYKNIQFTLIPPILDRPVLLDDTCYFLGFQTYKEALFFCTILNSPTAKGFYESIAFLNSKRPFTKEILMRMSFSNLANSLSFKDVLSIWRESNYQNKNQFSTDDFNKFQKLVL